MNINGSFEPITTIPGGSYTRQEMHMIWKALEQCNTCEVRILLSLLNIITDKLFLMDKLIVFVLFLHRY
jgi:hypothetical protein